MKNSPKSDKKITPLMKQYWEVKSLHTDKILFFRMGDFYELFDQDAIVSAPILGIALTSRNKNQGDSTAMCGMPHHSVGQYINKLLANNFKVAICDQIEDPKEAKGIVKRAVTRILSPGMVYDPDTLDQIQNNYLCSYDKDTVSFLEATTGEAFFYEYAQVQDRIKLIEILNPVELVLDTQDYKAALEKRRSATERCVSEHQVELSKYPQFKNLHISAQRLLSYAISMQGEVILNTLCDFELRSFEQKLELNAQTIKHLEIFETYAGLKQNSFFHVINKTKTAAGSRKLKNWIMFPLTSKEQIQERLNKVALWKDQVEKLKSLRSILAQMGDIERRLGKIANPNCNARDLVALKNSLKAGLEVSKIYGFKDKTQLEKVFNLIQEIENTVVEEPPISVRQGNMIKQGFSEDLDRLIKLSTDSQSLLNEMEQREKEAHGISSLKIRYNQVFGFYIEVTNAHKDKVPKHYVRKQTLTNAERYTTDELYKLEQQVLSAKTKREEYELGVFESLKHNILKVSSALLILAHEWSEIDVVTSFAWLAIENNYCAPEFSNDRSLKLVASRHPVVEQMASNFVANDIELFPSGCMLLTGPNMAGKSTLMRQVALTSLLFQIGCYVPASQARIPIFDRLYTRIGASDSLTEGLSTFMVEMTETAYLVKNASVNSLVILDEIGRGTSTYDGMSLAQAILEYLVTQVRSMTFFATHYHELTNLSGRYPQVLNAHMRVTEGRTKDIQFLYTLENGPANKSYGIEVAKLAGMPAAITTLAKKILESKEVLKDHDELPLFNFEVNADVSAPVEELAVHPVLEDLSNTDVMSLSPIQAIQKIDEWKRQLS